MAQRFISLWFAHLVTDWMVRRQPELGSTPFVLCANERGKLLLSKANPLALQAGLYEGMSLADARALLPNLEHFDEKPDVAAKLLDVLGDWCIRYTPTVSVDLPDGLMLEVSGSSHLFGGEHALLKIMVTKLRDLGYQVRGAMADTPGAAWAVARYAKKDPLVSIGGNKKALSILPPQALRLDEEAASRLNKLGITTIAELYALPRPSLSRRFGAGLLLRLDQALGETQELIQAKRHIEPYSERLTCPEGIATAEGIALALNMLLEKLCRRLDQEGKGLRIAVLEGYRVDGIVERIEIGTSRPTRSPKHIFRLFENKLETIEPALGIELFVLTTHDPELMPVAQNELLDDLDAKDDSAIPELMDRFFNHFERRNIYHVSPSEHHWPERSIALGEPAIPQQAQSWPNDKPRPIKLLSVPELIEVTAPVPDYPPMMFRHKGVLHRIKKADGPERIEREWWMDQGDMRDYYRLEDEAGHRYWVYRSGYFKPDQSAQWYLHGFFP